MDPFDPIARHLRADMDERDGRLAPFLATVAGFSGVLPLLQRPGAATADTTPTDRLEGAPLYLVGDVVLCLPLVGGKAVVVDRIGPARADVVQKTDASNAQLSTTATTAQNHMTGTIVLPAGTWDVHVAASLAVHHASGGAYVAADVTLGGVAGGTVSNFGAVANERFALFPARIGTGVAAGTHAWATRYWTTAPGTAYCFGSQIRIVAHRVM